MTALCIIDEVTASVGHVTFPVVDPGLYDFRPYVLSSILYRQKDFMQQTWK